MLPLPGQAWGGARGETWRLRRSATTKCATAHHAAAHHGRWETAGTPEAPGAEHARHALRYSLATSHYPVAETQKRDVALRVRNGVAARMTPAQIAEAQKRARGSRSDGYGGSSASASIFASGMDAEPNSLAVGDRVCGGPADCAARRIRGTGRTQGRACAAGRVPEGDPRRRVAGSIDSELGQQDRACSGATQRQVTRPSCTRFESPRRRWSDQRMTIPPVAQPAPNAITSTAINSIIYTLERAVGSGNVHRICRPVRPRPTLSIGLIGPPCNFSATYGR